MSMRILYVVNDANFFLSHRLPLALAAQGEGFDVHVATPLSDDVEKIRTAGFAFHAIPLTRRGAHMGEELASVIALYSLYRRIKPDLVHLVTIKPVLYGGIAARLASVPAVVSAVTGLGYVFIAQGLKASLLRTAVKGTYRFALGYANGRVIFQNPDDRSSFLMSRLVDARQTVLIKGSGVDMAQFSPAPEPPGAPLVVFAARMLWDKGVGEFVDAARWLCDRGIKARFALVGDTDSGNPAAVPKSQLEGWQQSGVVEWWGQHANMPMIFAKAHIVCLPSYREGLPKVLIEAAASGLPIVTTDVPGCREIVRHSENGLLVPVRDVVALAETLRRLIEDAELRRRMGAKGREIAVAEFSVERVVRETLDVYWQLLC